MSKTTKAIQERPKEPAIEDAKREAPQVRVRMPFFSEGDAIVSGPAAEAMKEGARTGYPPVILDGLMATMTFETEVDCIAHMGRLARLPRHEIPRIITELPPWLSALGLDEDVRVFEGGKDWLKSASVLRHSLETAIARRARGWLDPDEVAYLLAEAGAGGVDKIRADIKTAFGEGQLPFWRDWKGGAAGVLPMESDKTPAGYGHALDYGAYTHPECVDRWLDIADPDRRQPCMPVGPWTNGATGGELKPTPARPQCNKASTDRKAAILAALVQKFGDNKSTWPTYRNGDREGNPIRNAAQQALPGVGKATVRRLLKELRQAGDIPPDPQADEGRHRP